MLSKPEKHLILAQFTNSPWTGRSAYQNAGLHYGSSRQSEKKANSALGNRNFARFQSASQPVNSGFHHSTKILLVVNAKMDSGASALLGRLGQ
jgi:hypothetical protein